MVGIAIYSEYLLRKEKYNFNTDSCYEVSARCLNIETYLWHSFHFCPSFISSNEIQLQFKVLLKKKKVILKKKKKEKKIKKKKLHKYSLVYEDGDFIKIITDLKKNLAMDYLNK